MGINGRSDLDVTVNNGGSNWFPSPMGINGRSDASSDHSWPSEYWFPSPMGINGRSDWYAICHYPPGNNVSVPDGD